MPHCVSNIDKWTDFVKKCLLRHPISKNLCTPQHAHYTARVYLNAITKQKAYDLHNYVILPTTAARSQISLLRHRFITTKKEKYCLTTNVTATCVAIVHAGTLQTTILLFLSRAKYTGLEKIRHVYANSR